MRTQSTKHERSGLRLYNLTREKKVSLFLNFIFYLIGLSKLMEASESVAKLSKDLAIKEKELAVTSVKADKVSLK